MEERNTSIFLEKISNLLSITSIQENTILGFFISVFISIIVFFLVCKFVNNIKEEDFITLPFVCFFIIFGSLSYINNKKFEQMTIIDGFYKNIKDQNIVLKYYFTSEELEMIEYCLLQNDREIDFQNCLKKMIENKKEKVKENKKEIKQKFIQELRQK